MQYRADSSTGAFELSQKRAGNREQGISWLKLQSTHFHPPMLKPARRGARGQCGIASQSANQQSVNQSVSVSDSQSVNKIGQSVSYSQPAGAPLVVQSKKSFSRSLVPLLGPLVSRGQPSTQSIKQLISHSLGDSHVQFKQ